MREGPAGGAVVYAVAPQRLAAFYEAVAGLEIVHVEDDYVVLERGAFQLVVHGIPKAIAEAIEVTSPPVRREDAALKIVLPVASLAAAREAAPAHGGLIDPEAREWWFDGSRVCDGHDPEGNVIQLRESAD